MIFLEIFTIVIIVSSITLVRSRRAKRYIEKVNPKAEEPSKKNKFDKAPTKKVDYSYLKAQKEAKKKVEIVDILNCPECRTEQKNKDAIYCFKCGKDIYPKEFINIKKCPKCDKQYDDSYNFCENDGATLENKTMEVGKDLTMPMRWYKFITYLLFPASFLGYFYLAVLIDNDTLTVSLLFGAVFGAIIIYGLHNRTSWSWKLLIISYILHISTSRLDRVEDLGIIPYLIVVVIVNCIITYPNYIYFNKRKNLFVN